MKLHLQEQEGFEAFRHAYRAAIKEVRTKIEILSEDFAVRHDYNPIHHIERRLKTPDSIEEKLTRLGKEITIASARENIFDIAGSALTAQSQRLNVAASNLANADSVTGPDGQPYRAKQVVFQVNAAPGAATGGVKVADVIESQAPDKLVYEPGNPLADAKGYVKMPNVDVVGEMVNTMSASRSYQANVEVLNTVKSMMLKTLTLGQ